MTKVLAMCCLLTLIAGCGLPTRPTQVVESGASTANRERLAKFFKSAQVAPRVEDATTYLSMDVLSVSEDQFAELFVYGTVIHLADTAHEGGVPFSGIWVGREPNVIGFLVTFYDLQSLVIVRAGGTGCAIVVGIQEYSSWCQQVTERRA